MTSPSENHTPTPSGSGSSSHNRHGEAQNLISQLQRNWRQEMHTARLYQKLASGQDAGDTRLLLLEMSAAEQRHADHWRDRLTELGSDIPHLRSSLREVLLPILARIAGLPSVLTLVERSEAHGKANYRRQARHLPDAASRAIADRIAPEERIHLDTAARLRHGDITPGHHRSLRAYIGDIVRDLNFGLNDGLVSNFSLIAGVSGAAPSHTVVVLAGVAGLLAGTVSMGAGAYLSNKSQREVIDEGVRREAEEIEYSPDDEREELRRIYQGKGFDTDEVNILVKRITSDRERWIDTLVAEQLGRTASLTPHPAIDGIFTGGGFAVGAAVPLLPYAVGTGNPALIAAGLLSLAALFGAGAIKSLFTNRDALRSGAEMAIVGAGAAAFTYAVGYLIGSGRVLS